MDRIDKIMANKIFVQCMNDIEEAEKDRKFCLHGFEHSLDVARICYIMNLEQELGLDKEVIYATALLHDIGRSAEYKNKIPHHQAGAELAKRILKEAGFAMYEIEQICDAIAGHKQLEDGVSKSGLGYILYMADKLSRNCFDCKAVDECYWSEDIKNKGVTV